MFGAKVTTTTQEDPCVTDVQVLVWLKSAALVPVIRAEGNEPVLPELVTVNCVLVGAEPK